jgi:hypothetical protein
VHPSSSLSTATSVQGIVQLQARVPHSGSVAQPLGTPTTLKNSLISAPSVLSSAMSNISTIQQNTIQHSTVAQQQLTAHIQQAQIQQLLQAKALSQTVQSGQPVQKTVSSKAIDRTPVTTMCLVPNMVPAMPTGAIPIAKVFPQKQGIASTSVTSGVPGEANAVISQLLAARNTATVLPISLQEQLQRQLVGGPISSPITIVSQATSIAAPQSLYLGSVPVPIPSSSNLAPKTTLKIPSTTTTVSAVLPTVTQSGVPVGQLSGPGHFLPYYNNIMLSPFGNPNSSVSVGGQAVQPGLQTTVSSARVSQAAALIVAASAQPKKGGTPPQVITTSTPSTNVPVAVQHQIVASLAAQSQMQNQIQGIQPQNLPILKVPQVSMPSGSLTGSPLGLVASSLNVQTTIPSAAACQQTSMQPMTTLQIGSPIQVGSGLQANSSLQSINASLQSSAALNLLPVSRPVITTTVSSGKISRQLNNILQSDP